tara:strand:- start:2318 stop:2503 length:186 start_codon:yes stop_codon:yes gene_type:complete
MSSKVILKNVSLSKKEKIYKAVKLVNIMDPESFEDLWTIQELKPILRKLSAKSINWEIINE